MKVYLMEPANVTQDEILPGLKEALLDYLPGAYEDPVFSLSYERQDRFFLKKTGEILWGKVFFSSLGFSDIQALEQEIEQLQLFFRQPVRPYIFFPRCLTVSGVLASLPGRPHFFEYHFLSSSSGPAVAFREWSPAGKARVSTQEPESRIPKSVSYNFFRESRLNREELAELMELTFQFKSL